MEELTFDNLTEIEFLGHNFVFTGLTEKQEKEATKYVLRMQGIIRSSVVLQTDYLVVGTNQIMPTTKASRALELREKGHSLKIIEWDSFLALANAAMEQTTCLDFIISDGVLEHYYGQQKHVVVPEGVTAITNAVFAGKSDYFTGKVEEHYMESIVLPQTLNSIGDYAFYNCNNLQEITIPESVKSIGKYAFCGCKNLKTITILGEKTVAKQECFDKKTFDKLLSVLLPGQVPAAIKQDALYEFSKKYEAGAEMTDTYKKAWLKYIKGQQKKLVEAMIQNHALLQVLLKESNLGKDTYTMAIEQANQAGNTVATAMLLEYANQQGIKETEEKKLPPKITPVTPEADLKKLWSTKKMDDGTLALTAYKGDESTVTVPSQIGKQLVSVLENELLSCWKKGYSSTRKEYFKNELQKVIISEGISAISVGCFVDCAALKEIMFPDSLIRIERRAFDRCESLQIIHIPIDVEQIEAGAFSWCNALTDVYIMGKNTQINQYAFSNSPKVTIHAPKGSQALKFAKKYKIPFVAE